MNIQETDFIIQNLSCRRPTTEIFSFVVWLVDLAVENGVDISVLDNFVEENKRRFWNGMLRSFDRSEKYLGYSYHEAFDVERMLIRDKQVNLKANAIRADTIRMGYRWCIIDYLVKMPARQYEYIGAIVSKIMGSTKYVVTSAGGDGGVDFFALVPLHGVPSVCEYGNDVLRIVGQSKKYNSRLQSDQMRIFSDVLDDIRRGTGASLRQVPDWFGSVHSPIVGWVNAHSGFQSGAIEIAASRGILISDTPSLAQRIVQSRKVPVGHDEQTIRHFLDREIAQFSI